ncbi:MAG: hypothetical protein WC829_02475 [Hyphomicrobium sp.]|jgi:hypothetical protein
MSAIRLIALAVFGALLFAPPSFADKIIPRAGFAFAPLPTDEPVRKGMHAIRDVVTTNHSLVTHRRMPPDHAMRFAAQVKVEADRILSTTTLTGDALEKLRLLLQEIVTGLGAVAKPSGDVTANDGLAQADAALARYPQEFDDPNWKPLQALE